MSYNHDDIPKKFNENWMKYLPDLKLSEISIPGAHDACCRAVKIIWVQNQSWSLYDLLRSGVRFLDVRCRHYENKFTIHHGVFYLQMNFEDVLKTCVSFLENFPSETILMKIAEEYKEYNSTRSFAETFNEYYESYKNYIDLSNFIPNLNNVRKKIWILRHFDDYPGYNWKNLKIQDKWDLGTSTSLDDKKNAIKNHLNLAIQGDSNSIYANFCSAAGVFRPPFSTAEETNGIPFGYSGRMGIIIFDFPGEDIIKHVINQNFNIKRIIEIPLNLKEGEKVSVYIKDNKLYIEYLDMNLLPIK